MSNLIKHAEMEFRAAGWLNEDGNYNDDMQEAICKNALDIVRLFSEQGHSGFSASYLTQILEKLLRFEPLVPLTGEHWEWNEVGPGVFQNNRCSHVFKQADRFDGQAYDIEGRIFREANGACYTSAKSLVPVTFPYTPTKEYIDV